MMYMSLPFKKFIIYILINFECHHVVCSGPWSQLSVHCDLKKKKGFLENCKFIAFSTRIEITDPVNKKFPIIGKCVIDKYLRDKTMN